MYINEVTLASFKMSHLYVASVANISADEYSLCLGYQQPADWSELIVKTFVFQRDWSNVVVDFISHIQLRYIDAYVNIRGRCIRNFNCIGLCSSRQLIKLYYTNSSYK